MNGCPQHSANVPTIELAATMTIMQASELHRMLVERLAKGQPLSLDGTKVEEIDTAVLQLLASLWRTGPGRGVPCAWQGASAALCRSASLIGLSNMLQLPNARAESGGAHVPA